MRVNSLIFLILPFVLHASLSAAESPSGSNHDPRRAGWYNISASRVSLDESRAYFNNQGKLPKRKSANSASSSKGNIPDQVPTVLSSEIKELARGLENDPVAIYNFVRNHIDYVPYFGLRKGPTLTLLDRAGNDFDQAALLVALLRASGYTARYAQGSMKMPLDAVANWVGMDKDSRLADNLLNSVGIPYDKTRDSYVVQRVWVWLNYQGNNYQLDPAYKEYRVYPTIDVGSLIGYDQQDFLAAVRQGATVTDDYVQNLNDTNLRAKLTAYTQKLAVALRDKYPNQDINEITGDRDIVPVELSELPTSPSFTAQVENIWDEVDSKFADNFRVQHHGIDRTFLGMDVGGQRLTITYNGSANRPQLRLNGELIAEGQPASSGSSYDLTLAIDHALPADFGKYSDQEVSTKLVCNPAYVYVIPVISTALAISAGNLDRARARLASAIDQGSASNSEAVLGESLNIMGLTYTREHGLAFKLHLRMHGVTALTHHYFGVVRQMESVSIDWLAVAGSYPLMRLPPGSDAWTNERITNEVDAVTFPAWSIGSALEHGVVEQMFGSANPAFSSIKALWLQNAQGGKIYLARRSNFDGIETPLRSTYPSYLVDAFRDGVKQSGWVLLPEKGNLQLNQFTGSGWIGLTPSQQDIVEGYRISSALHGGSAGKPGVLPSQSARDQGLKDPANPTDHEIQTVPRITARDPVDMATGFFLVNRSDLDFGGSLPLGLQFNRSYNSGISKSRGSLGFGWSHSLDIRAVKRSNGFACFGTRTPMDAAALLVYAHVSKDIKDLFGNLFGYPVGPGTQYKQDVLGHTIWALAVKWVVDQAAENSVLLRVGHTTHEFIRLPDGTYSPPPGSTSELSSNSDGTFSIRERDGTRRLFDAENRLAEVTDIHGNKAKLTYSANKLAEIRDAYGRSLTLAYKGDLLTSVTDSAGRTVSYTYSTASDLIGVTDLAGFTWQYEYNTNHCITALIDPTGTTTAVNHYDVLNRVSRQDNVRQSGVATYNYHFASFRSAEKDPDGNRTTYFFDDKGRNTAVENTSKRRTTTKYDGQNHIVERGDARGNKQAMEYDARHNLVRQIDSLGNAVVFKYDSRNRLISTTDPLGHVTQFTWSDFNKITATRNALGIGTLLSYDSQGRPSTSTDPAGVLTKFTYDTYGNIATTTVSNAPPIVQVFDSIGNRLRVTDQAGATTSFEYEKRGLRTKMTDPLGKNAVYRYDAAGRLNQATNRKGETTRYTYTGSGKTDTVSYADGSSVHCEYDKHDRLIRATGPAGTTIYGYDAVNRLIRRTDVHGFGVGFAYDEMGNLVSLQYPGGMTVQYSYDNLNRLVGVLNWLGERATYAYDDAGRLAAQTNFNGTTVAYAYDDANRLISQEARTSAAKAIAIYKFTLDKKSNRIRIDEEAPLQPVLANQSLNYTYNVQRNRLISSGTDLYSYDDEGQLSAVNPTRAFRFDAKGRLVGVSGDLDLQFIYDTDDRRVRRVEPGIETRFIYDSQGNVLAEADSKNNITRYFIHGLGLLAMVDNAGRTYTYHYDGNANTVALTDNSQALINRYAYTPFGILANELVTIPQDFTFVGKYGVMRESTTMCYMRARYYDQSTGRFISEDPSSVATANLNLYQYAHNNPIGFIDATGLQEENAELGSALAGLAQTGLSVVLITGGAIVMYWSAKTVIVSLPGVFTLPGAAGVALGTIGFAAGWAAVEVGRAFPSQASEPSPQAFSAQTSSGNK